jgi:precorrin-6Y C5,15-methyltransferase (decarboxylating) CbiT subunit
MKRVYRTLQRQDETPTEMVIRAFLGFPLQPKVLWDIGCGSGKVLIESKLRYRNVTLIGIESNPDYVELMQDNMKRHGVEKDAVTLHLRDVLDMDLSTLPRPDAIYLGCAGLTKEDVIPKLWPHLNVGGVIVTNVGMQHPDEEEIPERVVRLHNAHQRIGGKLEEYHYWQERGVKKKPVLKHALHWEARKTA